MNCHSPNHLNLKLYILCLHFKVYQLLEIRFPQTYNLPCKIQLPFLGGKSTFSNLDSGTPPHAPFKVFCLFPPPSSFLYHFLPNHPSSIQIPHLPTCLQVVGEYRQTQVCRTTCKDLEDWRKPSLRDTEDGPAPDHQSPPESRCLIDRA